MKKITLRKKLLPALIAAALSGCGGGDSPPQNGSTVSTHVQAGAMVACVDVNANLQCDDGDVTVTSTGAGPQNLSPSGKEYVLLETRDATNQRTRLLVSEPGSASVTGLSTLRTFLKANGKSATDISALEAQLTARHGNQLESLLEQGFASALNTRPLMLDALTAYSLAVAARGTAQPALGAYSANLNGVSTDVTWSSSEASNTQRHLSVQGTTVLSNSESNRLYLFDGASSTISAREVDLIPPATPALASATPLVRDTVGALDRMLSLAVDTVSAATGFATPPVNGSPVVLAPGKGITAIQIADDGNSAFVLLNMLAGGFTGGDCIGTSQGNEGLFKINLTDGAAYRWLAQTPTCVHSGFSLLATDPAGSRVAAWDATASRLWLLDGGTLAKTNTLDPGFAPQALAVTPGGRYLAAAGFGRLTLIDMNAGHVVTQLTGSWSNVTQVAFADGGRRVLLTSGNQVYRVALDDQLQLISTDSVSLGDSNATLQGLSVATDGDSFVATSNTSVYWLSGSGSTPLAQTSLPAGMTVQQTALAGTRLTVLARGGQDQQFRLMRTALPLPATPSIQ